MSKPHRLLVQRERTMKGIKVRGLALVYLVYSRVFQSKAYGESCQARDLKLTNFKGWLESATLTRKGSKPL